MGRTRRPAIVCGILGFFLDGIVVVVTRNQSEGVVVE